MYIIEIRANVHTTGCKMDSDDEPKTYTELTPVTLQSPQGSRTEVKVPVTPRSTEHTSVQATGINSYDAFTAIPIETYGAEANNDSSLGGYCGGEAAQGGGDDGQNGQYDESYLENTVYKTFVSIYRGLPKEMFVSNSSRKLAHIVYIEKTEISMVAGSCCSSIRTFRICLSQNWKTTRNQFG